MKDEKTNMFKKKPQNKRFSFNHSNDANDNRNNERDSTNNFQYNNK